MKKILKRTIKRTIIIMALIMTIALAYPATANAASHEVQKGETWYSIAKRYGVTISELTTANGRSTSDYVRYGETITIPTKSSTTTSNSSSKTHIVAAKETWYSIAKRYGVTISELATANGRTQNDFVKVGETLTIPCKTSTNTIVSSNSGSLLHTVSLKETWYSIAKRYGITVSKLTAANGRSSSDFVYVGEILLIPTSSSSNSTSSSSTVKKFSVTLQTTSTDQNSWYNVKLAASKLNGMTLAPNSKFSWFSFMGPCNASDGYKTATIYSNGTVSQAPGGGICMVSTALMQSARGAGCKIIEKHDHSLPVSYATRGNEATVSWGTKNLQFANTSNKTLKFTCSTNDANKTCTITCTPIN